MARDYASSSNIIYNPAEAEKKRHSSSRDYRKSVGESGSRDYRTATVKQETQKPKATTTPSLPELPTLGESVDRMNSMIPEVSNTSKLGIIAPKKEAFKPQTKKQKKAAAKLLPTAPTVRTFENVERDAEPFSNLRELPVVGPVYRGLDRLQEFTEPAAKIAQEFYTPGAGLAPIAGFTGAVGSAISRVAPRLGDRIARGAINAETGLAEGGASLGERIARGAIQEAAAGTVLGAGQSLAAHPERGFTGAGEGAAYGGVLGGLTGAAGPLLGAGIKRLLGSKEPITAEPANTTIQPDARDNEPIVLTAENPTATLQTNPPQVKGQQAEDELFSKVVKFVNDGGQPTTNGLQREFRVGYPVARRMIDRLEAGEVPKPAEPIQPVTNAAQAPKQGQGIRANYANQLDNGNFSPELQQGIRNADQRYDIARNADSVNTASENVKNLPKAEADFHANESGGAEHIATGYRLMQELDALGEHQRALNVANKLAKDLTKSGQTSQAASILSRLSPEGQLLNLTRTAERNGKAVTVEDKVKFQELAAEVQEKTGAGVRENKLNDILDRLEKGETIPPEDMKFLGDYLERANKIIKPKEAPAAAVPEVNLEDAFPEFKNPKKREKIISFLETQEQKALERIKARKTRLNALPIDEWADHAIVVAAQLAKGSIKAATHVEDLVKLFGDEIRPVATAVYKRAQGIVKGVVRSSAEGKLDEATKAFSKVSGEAGKEKAMVEETADHVRKLIADAKKGELNPEDIQKLRDYADEIAALPEKPKRVISDEQRFLQQVKTLSKKIAEVEDAGGGVTSQENKEIANLIRKIAKLQGDEPVRAKMSDADANALSDIAHDVMKVTRPTAKPKTLQEKIVAKYIKQNPQVSESDVAKLRELAKDVTRLSGDQKIDADMAMQKILNSYEKSNLWDKVTALRYIGMLLNTGTQLINAGSGPIMASTGYVADIFGTMLDTVLSKALKQPRTTTLYAGNPLDFMVNYMNALKKGAKAGWQGVNPAGIQSTGEIRGLTFKSVKNPLTFIPAIGERTLGAVAKGADFAAYSAINKGEMIKQGYLDALKNGVKGRQAIKQHINKFVNDPTEAAILQADRIAKDATFQRADKTAGKVANYVNSAPAGLRPFLSAIFPFVRTPINIASTAVTMTPAGIIKGLFQLTSKSEATKREAIRTLSLGLTGSGIGVLGYYLSNLGIITGANDSGNKDADAVREQAGQGKYRFNTSALMRYLAAMVNGEGSQAAEKAAQYQKGDKQFDYNKLQPLAFPLAIGAGVEKNKGKGVAGTLAGAGTDAYGSLYGMSTLKGVQDVFQPSYGGTLGEKALGAPARIVESFLKSFSPSLLAQEARRQDPIVRKVGFNNGIVQDVKESFMSRTPGLSQKLPPSKTTLGQDKKNAPGITGQYLNPYKSDVAPYNEAAVIVSGLIDRTKDLSLAPTAPDKKVTGKDGTGNKITVAILPDRYAKLQEDIGKEITSKIISMNQSQSDADQAITIEKIYTAVRKKYMDQVKKELGIQVR